METFATRNQIKLLSLQVDYFQYFTNDWKADLPGPQSTTSKKLIFPHSYESKEQLEQHEAESVSFSVRFQWEEAAGQHLDFTLARP